MKKRFLAALLTLAMLIGMLPTNAFASEVPESPETTASSESTVTSDLTFDVTEPDGYVTVSFVDNGVRPENAVIDNEALYGTPVGTIIEATQVPYKEGDSVAAVTVRLLDAMKISYDSTGTVDSGFYLAGLEEFELNGTYYATFSEFDAGSQSGWCVRLNNWHINQSSSAFEVEDGDVVSWLYTCQYGADVGADFSSKSAEITDVVLSDESLSLVAGEDGNYTCEVPADISAIAFEVKLANYASVVTVTVDGNEVKYRPNVAINVTNSSTIVISTALDYMDAENNNQVTTYTDSVTIQLTPENQAPTVVEGAPTTMEAVTGKEISVDLSNFFTDADGDALTYTVKIETLSPEQTLEGSVFTGTIPTAGTYEVVATASDGETSVSHTVTLTVADAPNTAPVVAETAPATMEATVNEEISVDLSAFFSDADGDALTYKVKIAALNVDQTLEGSVFTGTIPTAGTYEVVATASDGEASVSHTVTLTVAEAPTNTAPNIKAAYAETNSKTYVYSTSYVYIYMDEIFEDADGDTLTYSATLNGEPVEITYNSYSNQYYIPFATKPAIYEYKIVANDGTADSEVFTALCIGTSATITAPEDSALIPGGTDFYYIKGSAENDTFALDYSLDVDCDIVPTWESRTPAVLALNEDGTFTVGDVTSRKQVMVGVTYGKDSWGSTLYLGTKYINILPAAPTVADMTAPLAEHADNQTATVVSNAFTGWYSSEFNYEIADPSICDITTSGTYGLSITPKALGRTTVTATFKYDETIKCTFTVTVTGRSLQIKDQPESDDVTFADGKTVQLEVLGAEEGETFTWTISDETVATIDENGLVTVKKLGQTYITAVSSLSTEETTLKASMYLQVKEADKVYLDDLAVTDYSYFDGFVSAKSGFNSAQLTYDWSLSETRYTYNKLAFTPYFDAETLTAVLHYQVSGGEYQTMDLTSGTAVSIANGLNPGENVVKIDVYPTDNAANVTTYIFNIFRPYNPNNTISRMTIYPGGETALSYPTYLENKEGTIFQWNAETGEFVTGWNGKPATVWNSNVYTYKTFIFGSRTDSISVYPTFAYAGQRVMIYVDGEPVEEAVTNWKSKTITIDKENGTVIAFHVNSEKYHAEQLAAGVEDPFAEPEKIYTLYVESVEPLGIDSEILSAELEGGVFYLPGFSSTSYTISGLIPSGETTADLTFTVPAGIDVYKTSVSDANKLTPTGQDENGNNLYTTPIVTITGTGMYAYSTTNIILQVTDADGNIGKTQYAFTVSQRGAKDIYPDSIVEYLCLGSQYTNSGGYGLYPERTLKDGGGVLSLGNFGGYIIYKYDKPIENNPNNPYGVDFVIYGNPFGNGAHEPGYVQVSEDGETWYTLAGSAHYDDYNDWDYSMTYTNNNGKSAWTNSDDESGEIYNYPSASLYPYFTWTEELEQSMTVTGPRLNSSAKDAFGSAAAVLPVFGYVDVNTNGSITGASNNPYNHPGTLAEGGDMFDLDWAVDEDGMPVELDSISYIRIATASSIYAGAIGEKSTEVTAVLRVTNAAEEAVGVTAAPTVITVNGTEITVPENGGTLAVAIDPVDTAETEETQTAALTVGVTAAEDSNIYINDTFGAERSYTAIPEKGIIRIIVQEGEKEPYICYLTISEKIVPTFAALDFYKSSKSYNNGEAPLEITPTFVGTTYTGYSIDIPDYLSSVYAVGTLPENLVNSGFNGAIMFSNAWGGWSGRWASDGIIMSSVNFTKGYVSIYFSDARDGEYQINVSKYTTLKGLTIDGVVDKEFNRDTTGYHAYADSTAAGIAITPTAYNSAYAITINGTTVTSGQEYVLAYDWDENGKMEVKIEVSGEGLTTSVYTVELEKQPLEDAPFIMTQPEEADYIVGDTTAALSVVASANGELAYQWYTNTAASNEGGTAIENATESTYTPSSETVGTVYYYCVITNTDKTTGNVTVSEAARVTVDPDPTPVAILTNPGSALPDDYEYGWETGYVYTPGEEATALTVQATSAAEGGTWSYQWYRTSNRGYNINSYALLSGATSESYTPDTDLSLANDGGYYYWCKVTYSFKGKNYETKSVTGETYTTGEGEKAKTYDVNAAYVFIKVTEAAIPEITKQPVSAEYVLGDTATALSVISTKADGGKVTYQWYVNTENSTENAAAIEGARSSSYNLGTLSEVGTNYYYCVITNTIQGYTASVTSEIAEITVKTVQEMVGTSLKGSGTETDPYQLATAEDYKTLADLVAKGVSFSGMYFKQLNDIELPADWAGIGALKAGTTNTSSGRNINPFSGILDGNDKKLTFAYGSVPLFKYVRETAVKNLKIYGEYIAEDGLVSDYVVDYGTDGSYNSGTGGSYAAGCPDVIDITNVTILSGTTIKGSGFIGGFASGGNIVNINNCTVESGVKIGWDAEANAPAGSSRVGSFGGDFNGTIMDSTSAAAVYGVNYVGGIVGSKGQSMGPYKIINCSFTGEVIATGTMVGGIAGGGYTSSSAPNSPCATIENCYVAGKVTGTDKVGGIFGGEAAVSQCWANGAGYIRNNHFYGTVTATEGTAGGIIGYMHSLDRYNVIENNFFVDTCGADKGIGAVNAAAVDLTSEKYGRDDDPLGEDADKLTTAMTAEEFKDETVRDLLNVHESSLHNWIQSDNHPVHSKDSIAYLLEVSGDYETEYVIGDELDLTGMTLTATWSDGSVTNPTLDEATVTGFDNTVCGQQTLTISYGAAKAEITVTVQKDPADPINVSLTISVKGEVVMAQEEITVSDVNGDGRINVDEALYAAHESGYTGGAADGYASSVGSYGLAIDKLWGDVSGLYGYWLNNASCWSLDDEVRADDYLVAFVYQNSDWSDAYTAFDEFTYTADGELTVTLKKAGYDQNWNTVFNPLAGATITVYDADGKAVDASKYTAKDNGDGTYTLAFTESGDYTLIASKGAEIVPAVCKAAVTAEQAEADVENIYKTTGDYLTDLAEEYGITVGSTGGEWLVIGLERADRNIPDEEGYYDAVVEYVNAKINDKEQLHRAKSTENSRVILALTAMGYDVTDVDGHNLLVGLNSMSYLKKQGINGPIWALIAFDSHDYEIPEGGDVTREALVDYILSVQLADGGWTLSGSAADTDMTGMALQALAPYYETDPEVKAAVDRALNTLSSMQLADGSFGSVDGSCSESCAQVIVALTALGINPETDERFVKNGSSVVDALCSFYVDGGGFMHVPDSKLDGMATEQGYYGLAAYFRFLNGQTSLYDMSDVELDITPEEPENPDEPETPGDFEYLIISGADSTWKKASTGKVAIICNGEFSDFTALLMDGTAIDPSKYTAVSGSTIVTLESAYLETLSVGTHTVTFTYVDGEVSTGLTVLASSIEPGTTAPSQPSVPATPSTPAAPDSETPDTGDHQNSAAMFGTMFGALALAAILIALKKKYRFN
ncbi:MAG: bacterial Ig-like domain-containing protein [Lachnospiraceae bacterium]|nr:bacterial Ig-like domain-containing protein [Lachnospiraceae bacterium]